MSAAFTDTARLGGAHIGYEYQDLVGAALLAVGLVEGLDALGTEIPRGADSAFDDIELHRRGRVVRWQLKHSTQSDRRLEVDDLKGGGAGKGELALARMVAAAGAQPKTADEYRVLVTWSEPVDDELAHLLVLAETTAPALPGWSTRRYRLNPDVIWPQAGRPARFSGLDPAEAKRRDLLALCDRTVFEFGALPMSKQLLEPGPAEAWLLSYLTEHVGLGRFPNRMAPEVAADRLVRLANHARPRAGAINLVHARQRLELTTAFGRLEQLSPVEPAHEVRRRRQAAEILRAAATRPVTVLIAGPGHGKTWAVEEIERLARRAGAVVARHYCYLRPDDTLLEERIRGDQMIAHLVADLVEAVPELAEVGPAYAADLERLDDLLDANAQSPEPREILLIVDGLDHVERIRARSRHLANADVDLVERLASLQLADNAHLLVLSQPGEHLAALGQQGRELRLPEWDEPSIEDLSRRLGLDEAAMPRSSPQTVRHARRLCVQRAAGSPLYCTYVARSVLGALAEDPDADVDAIVERLPAAGADLANYYAVLLTQAAEASPGSRDLAYLLGVADFALSAEDARQIVGPLAAPTVDRALRVLRPLLTEVGAEAAYRIHHESFQRFVVESLQAEGVPLSAVTAPLVTWLHARGLFADARAFRHLLPTLLRGGQLEGVLSDVGSDFVAQALASGHPHTAVMANLATAAAAGAELADPAALVRCAELARAAATAYEDKLDSVEQFAAAYAQAHGPEAVAERLVFDGRATWPRRAGLHLCAACDRVGGVPPWREYLDLPRHPRSDVSADERQEQEADRAGWLGRLRLADDPVLEAKALLRGEVDGASQARTLLSHLGHVAGHEPMAEIVPDLVEGPPRLGGWLEVAAARQRTGDAEGRIAAAEMGLAQIGPPRWLHETIELGADPGSLADRAGTLEEAVLQAGQLAALDYIHDSAPVELFTLRLRVHAAAGADLGPVRAAIVGGAWWHDWLRFCVDEATGGIDGDRLAALRRLAADAHPFAGKPRAVDLWHVSPEIARSVDRLMRGLPLERWPEALALLRSVARDTGGAYSLSALLDFCKHHLDRSPQLLSDFAVARITEGVAAGHDLYETVAGLKLRLADFYARTGRSTEAGRAWLQAAGLFAAYGYRKDVTVFDLIDSLPELGAADPARAVQRAERLQRYSSLVVDHTDRSETSHAPGEWFRRLTDLHPALAAQSLAHALRWRGGIQDYRLEEGLERVLETATDSRNSRLLEAIGSSTRGALVARRRAAERLLGQDREEGELAAVRLIAAADGDSQAPLDGAVEELLNWARDHGIEADAASGIDAARVDRSPNAASHSSPTSTARLLEPPLAEGHGVGALLRTIRSQRFRDEGTEEDERFVLAFGLRLVELAQDGEQITAARVLRAFARGRRMWDTGAPMVWLVC